MMVLGTVLVLSGLVDALQLKGIRDIEARQSPPSAAVCTKAQWSYNSRNASPCQVLQDLATKCVPTFNLQPITNTTAPYQLPTGAFNNDCMCNIVAYNLIAACSWCQDGITQGQWVTEKAWRGPCTTYDYKSIPQSVSMAGLYIPKWAFDEQGGLAWLPQIAEAEEQLNLPDVTSLSATPTAPPVSVNPSPTPTYGSASGTSTNVGAIVGGTIGGIVCLIAVLGIIALVISSLRRSQRQTWTRPMAQHYRSGGLAPWQTQAAARRHSSLLALPPHSPNLAQSPTGSTEGSRVETFTGHPYAQQLYGQTQPTHQPSLYPHYIAQQQQQQQMPQLQPSPPPQPIQPHLIQPETQLPSKPPQSHPFSPSWT